MSFRIHSNAAAACPPLGTQERHAHDRHHPHGSSNHAPHGAFDESANNPPGPSKSSLAIRRAQDCQAVLGDALGLLHTQDQTLALLQTLPPASEQARILAGENFNGLPVFSGTGHPDPIWIENIETPEAVEVPRPPVPSWLLGDSEALPARLAEARDANRRAQLHIEAVLETNRTQLLEADLAPHQLTHREDVPAFLEASRLGFLANPRAALAIQANCDCGHLLHLFD